nr:MAK10-like protein [Tanacetum cinerariifolium]
MGDTNPICTLGDYSKPSHVGYSNTIQLPVGNNVLPLRSDIIQLVQNECSLHGLWSKDTNQHLKDFLELLDSLDLDGSITTWEDLTTYFFAQFFPPERTAKLFKKNDDSHKEELKARGLAMEYSDIFLTRSELAYHMYHMCRLIPLIFLRNPIIMERYPSNLKIPCNIGHVHVEKAYIDLKSTLNIITRMVYNWIRRIKLDPRENSDMGVSNFTGRIKGIHAFVRNFTYVIEFMIIEDISSIIDPRLSQVVLGKPFVEISNMTHNPPKGVVRCRPMGWDSFAMWDLDSTTWGGRVE